MAPRAKRPNASWSATEDDAFLRAWASVVERERDGSFHRALFETFVELCGGATETQRTETSLMQRRGVYMRMYDIVCGFHNRHNAPPPLAADAGDGAAHDKPAEPYSSDDYFELSRAEQRRWIASLDPRTLSMLDIDRPAFERVQRIIMVSDPDRAQRPPFWRRERLPSKTASESSKTKSDKVKKRRGSGSTKTQGSSTAASPAHRSARSSDGGADDSGSSTESDDDVVHTRRLSSRASELGDAQSRRTSTAEPSASSEPAADRVIEEQAPDPLSSEPQSLALDSATANLVRLVDLLRDQATRLHTMFTQAEQERTRDSRERQRAVKMMRVSRDHVLEHVRRCERTLKQGREECEKERAAVERELKRLKESSRQETRVPDAL